MLAYIQLLYEIEREARQGNLNPDQRRELRQTRSRPILEDIKNYLQTEKPKILPKSPIGEAIEYTLYNWEALLRYKEDDELYQWGSECRFLLIDTPIQYPIKMSVGTQPLKKALTSYIAN